MPLTHDPYYVIYEYACHEGNQAIRNILSAGREREKREAAELWVRSRLAMESAWKQCHFDCLA